MSKELPGHIKKAFRSVDRFLPVVDLIVELVDARMPWGSRLRGFIDRLDKQSIIALGKADLADKQETKKWIDRYRKEGIPALALDARNRSSVKKLANLIKASAFRTKPGVPPPTRKVRRVMIIGIPNVGKSTLINSLAGRKAAQAANRPGLTRDIQWIKLPGSLELLDLPGILDFSLLKRGDILRLINTMPGNAESPFEQAKLLTEILTRAGQQFVLPGFAECESNFDVFIEHYAKRMNFLLKGGNPDEYRAATDIIRRFQSGGFGQVTLEKSDQDFEDLFAPAVQIVSVPEEEDV